MSFNTLVFPVFFLTVFALFWAVPLLGPRKILLLVFSYVFYSSFKPSHLFILLGLTAFNFVMAFLIERATGRSRLAILIGTVSIDLAVLAYYKYISFLITNLNGVFNVDFGVPTILLPIGISFYTFEVISYIADVYRRKISAERSLLDFALLLAFFPRLVAGPIVRPADFLPQLKIAQKPQLVAGLELVLIGMFQKLVIADYLMAPVVDWYFAVWTHTSPTDTWIAIIAFAVQIYCDFNGYTLCAIGLALLLGFRLPINFDNPYAAVSLTDFWRRWHISLSSWIRDYLYISLGGNRHGLLRTCLNLLTAMALAGLWHGASWNFVLWGIFHGSIICFEHLCRYVADRFTWARYIASRILTLPPIVALHWAVTFIVVCLAWVPFRAPTLQITIYMANQMVAFRTFQLQSISSGEAAIVLGGGALVIGVQIVNRWYPEGMWQRWYVRSLAYGAMAAALVSMGGDLRSFIYFQF